jgi:hypothetical protein
MVRLQNEESLDRYITYLSRFMCYCLRVYVAQKERKIHKERSDETDEETDEETEEDTSVGEDSEESEDVDNLSSANESVEESDVGLEDRGQQTNDSDQNDVMKDCCDAFSSSNSFMN